MTLATLITRERHVVWIDILRLIAIMLVVLCHSTEEGIYNFALDSVMTMQPEERIFPFVCFTVGRIGVPIFLLISGYLLLDHEYNRKATIRFWKKNWLHLIACTMFWFLVYDLFLIFNQGEKLQPGEVIQDVLFLYKVEMSHVWYMPMIVGLYAFIPFVGNALSKVEDKKLVLIPIAFFFVCLFVYPTFSIAFRIIAPNLRIMSNQIGAGFSGGIYGIYLLVGWLIKKGTYKKVRWYWLLAFTAISVTAAVFIQLLSYSREIRYSIWYDSPFLLIAAASIVELFSRIRIKNNHNTIRWLASYAFGIYLVHFPFKLLLLDPIMKMESSKECEVLLLWGLLMAIGFIVSIIISSIPKMGNYLLYRRSKA